jgi:hypothetical protein
MSYGVLPTFVQTRRVRSSILAWISSLRVRTSAFAKLATTYVFVPLGRMF